MKTLKLLVLYPKYFWDCKMSSVRRHSIEAIMRRDDVDVVLSGVGWESYHEHLTAKENLAMLMHDADAVLWYKPEGSKQVKALIDPKGVGVPAILRFNECWWPDNQAANEVLDSGSSIVICHHWNDMMRFTHAWQLTPPEKTQRVVRHSGVSLYNVHHCAEKSVYLQASRPWKDRDIAVLVTGVISPEIYPLRSRVKNLIDSGLVKGTIRSHPGYRTRSLEENDAQVRDYADMLGRSRCVVSCASRYQYALAKFSEIAMAGACLVSDAPGECDWYSGLWEDCFELLDITQPADKMAEFLNDLPRRRETKTLARRAQEMTLQYFTQEDYARRFVRCVRDHIKRHGKTSNQ